MNRINVLNESKFERMTKQQLQVVCGGGICVSCKKRTKKIPIVIGIDDSGHTVKG